MKNNYKLEKTYKDFAQFYKRKYKKDRNDILLLKNYIYNIGKIVSAMFFLKSDYINKNDFNNIIYSNDLDKLPDMFSDFQNSNNFHMNFTYEECDEVINKLDVLNKEQLSKILLGKLYESLTTNTQKKKLGQVYTPQHIIKEMVNSSIHKNNIINNPYFKVIDPACGSGYFLIDVYDKLKNIIENNLENIIEKHPKLDKEIKAGVNRFIINNCIWGADIDDFAIFMTKFSFILKLNYNDMFDNSILNIYIKDILLDRKKNLINILDKNNSSRIQEGIFDLVIGNPPYLGHKKVDKEYKKHLYHYYNDVYFNKSDISYCFFKKGYELLKKGGELVFITSRYFMEAPSAKGLRKFIKNNLSIEFIKDFYGKKVFKGIGISPTIIKCVKDELVNDKIHIYKLNTIKNEEFQKFIIEKQDLKNNGWVIINKQEKKLLQKIKQGGTLLLKDVCRCYQGVITGCDKAFIVSKDTIIKEKLEEKIIRPWVKNSNIGKYNNIEVSKYILYTDEIKDIVNYKNTIKHLKPYKCRLMRRRECKKGIRKWYELQWGRKIGVFESPKIIFPFKARTNRFTLDYDNLLCSADIYVIKLIDSTISIEYLLAYLNSSIFEFYFKCVAKKVGKNLYEYYPNKIMNLNIKIVEKEEIVKITEYVRKIFEINSKIKLCNCLDIKEKEKLIDMKKKIEKQIDNLFFSIYKLSEKEKKIIANNI